MSDLAISTTGLTRDFGTVRALDGLSLEVPSGVVFGYLGPNGSGKTTTINLLLGLLEPTDGSASVLGIDTRDGGDGIRARTGAVLEHPGVYEELTAEENLEFYGQVWRIDRQVFEVRVHELLGTLGLWERRHERVEGWSRGMRQKLALARAMLHQPALLFLDEPTAGLDPIGAAAFDVLTRELKQTLGLTVFLITHDLDTLHEICDRVAVLADRKVIAVDTVLNLMKIDHPWIQEYFNGPRGRAALTAQALDELRKHMDMPIAANAVKALDKSSGKKA